MRRRPRRPRRRPARNRRDDARRGDARETRRFAREKIERVARRRIRHANAANALAPADVEANLQRDESTRYSSPARARALAHDASENPRAAKGHGDGDADERHRRWTTSTRGCATYVSGAGASRPRRVASASPRNRAPLARAPAGKRHANAAASSSVASAGAAATGPTVPILHAACRHDGAPPPTMETTAGAPPPRR